MDAPSQFSDSTLLVLISLADGAKHGHAMLNDIEAMVGRRLGPGTLYGAIARLEAEGLIEPLPAEDRRKPYRLTAAGLAASTARVNTLRRIATIGGARLGLA